MTGYTIDSTAGALPHQVNLLFPGTYLHTWVFPSVRAVFGVTFIPDFVVFMD